VQPELCLALYGCTAAGLPRSVANLAERALANKLWEAVQGLNAIYRVIAVHAQDG